MLPPKPRANNVSVTLGTTEIIRRGGSEAGGRDFGGEQQARTSASAQKMYVESDRPLPLGEADARSARAARLRATSPSSHPIISIGPNEFAFHQRSFAEETNSRA